MKTEGPAIEELTRHLAECPESFLGEPIQPNGVGEVNVAAVIQDLLCNLGGEALSDDELKSLQYSRKKRRNRLRLTLVSAWLSHSPHFRACCQASKLRDFLLDGLGKLATLVPAEQFVAEPERREELARLLLASVGVRPLGEKKEEAENRLDALSTEKRDEVVRAAKAAEERARKLREEMARKERERRAASVYSHE